MEDNTVEITVTVSQDFVRLAQAYHMPVRQFAELYLHTVAQAKPEELTLRRDELASPNCELKVFDPVEDS